MPCLSPVLPNSLVDFLVIVRQFDVMRSARPAKANPPLIVNANRVLLRAIPLQLFQSIRRRLPQVLHLFRRIDGDKLLEGANLHIGRDFPNSGAGFARPEICCSGVREAVNHASMKVASSPVPGKGIFTPSVKTRRPADSSSQPSPRRTEEKGPEFVDLRGRRGGVAAAHPGEPWAAKINAAVVPRNRGLLPPDLGPHRW
jgi:hypothetical protein